MRNVNWVNAQLDRGAVDDLTVTLLADPQTSGGLVFGIEEKNVDTALSALASGGHRAAQIGRARAGTGTRRLASKAPLAVPSSGRAGSARASV